MSPFFMFSMPTRCWRALPSLAIAIALCLHPTTTRAQDAAQGDAGPRLTKAPQLLEFVEAAYPDVTPQPDHDVSVTLQVLIDVQGRVAAAKVVASAGPLFDQAALDAVKMFVFSPAEVDDQPSPIWIEYRYVFTLQKEEVAPTTGVLAGVVKNAGDGRPLADVEVVLASGAQTTTDAEGRFHFDDLPPGTLTLTLQGEGFTPLQAEETLVAGEELEVSYAVALQPEVSEGPSDDLELLVTAPPTLKREAVSTKVSAREARVIPGAQGDVVRVVENLPGVARSAVGSGQLVVWGAAPEDTRTYVDGVPIPRLYHQGGLRSTVHSAVVESVELVPGGYGAAFGRGLGGIVRVETRTPDAEGLHGSVSANVFDAAASLSSTIGPRWRAAAAGRVSVIDLFAGSLDSEIGDYVPIPRYRDATLRVTRQIESGGRVDLVALASTDHTSRGVPNADPALATRETRDISFYRLYANYIRERGQGSRSVVTPYVGFGNQDLTSHYGDVPTSLSQRDVLAGVRASHRVRVAPWLSVEGGVDAEVGSYDVERRGSLGLPAREGDVRVFGQPPPDSLGYDRFTATTVGIAPYVEADFALLRERLHVVPGLRADPMFRSVSRRLLEQAGSPALGLYRQSFTVDPRLALRYAINDRLALHAATGIYHQLPAPSDLSAKFGNPALDLSRAYHFVIGSAIGLTDLLTLELTGFATFLEDLTMRNTAESPRQAEALVASGEGRSMGLQALVRRELADGLFGWVAYTIMRSERKNSPSSATRLFDYDQTHVVSTVLVWTPWRGFEVGSRFRLSSGFPRTPVIATYYDARRDRTEPVFGEQNSIRIPLFMQLDVRVGQTFDVGDTKLDVYLELQNVTNRDNAEELVYSPDFSTRDHIRSLPILPVVGIEWTF